MARGASARIAGPARVVEWQTRGSQKPLGATPCEFESHLGHHEKQRLPAPRWAPGAFFSCMHSRAACAILCQGRRSGINGFTLLKTKRAPRHGGSGRPGVAGSFSRTRMRCSGEGPRVEAALHLHDARGVAPQLAVRRPSASVPHRSGTLVVPPSRSRGSFAATTRHACHGRPVGWPCNGALPQSSAAGRRVVRHGFLACPKPPSRALLPQNPSTNVRQRWFASRGPCRPPRRAALLVDWGLRAAAPGSSRQRRACGSTGTLAAAETPDARG